MGVFPQSSGIYRVPRHGAERHNLLTASSRPRRGDGQMQTKERDASLPWRDVSNVNPNSILDPYFSMRRGNGTLLDGDARPVL